jgi:hypothetical protein
MSFVPDLAQSCRENDELLTDLARFSEGLYTEKFIRRKYRDLLSEDDWVVLATDDLLVEMVETRKLQRVRDGSLKREKAQMHLVRGPDALAAIMDNPKANARHVVDAIKTLDQLATPEASRFDDRDYISIRIDLGADTRAKGQPSNPGDVLIFDAPIRPVDTIDATSAPVRSIPNNSIDELPPIRRGRGRPKGSKNKPKQPELPMLNEKSEL